MSRYYRAADDLERQGLTVRSNNGMMRKNPLVEIIKNERAGFLSACRQLGVDGSDEAGKRPPGRPVDPRTF